MVNPVGKSFTLSLCLPPCLSVHVFILDFNKAHLSGVLCKMARKISLPSETDQREIKGRRKESSIVLL